MEEESREGVSLTVGSRESYVIVCLHDRTAVRSGTEIAPLSLFD